MSASEVEPAQIIAPLLEGRAGVSTCLMDGRGVVLRIGQSLLPWAPTLTEDLARRRNEVTLEE